MPRRAERQEDRIGFDQPTILYFPSLRKKESHKTLKTCIYELSNSVSTVLSRQTCVLAMSGLSFVSKPTHLKLFIVAPAPQLQSAQ